jgi:hypothetical protein
VVETVARGEITTQLVTFTSSEDLVNVATDIVAALQPYVHATPASFPSISAGVAVTLTLTLSAPAQAPLATVEGTLHVRQTGGPPSTVAPPLPITLTIVPETQPPVSVSGRVLFDTGAPVAGAVIRGSLAAAEVMGVAPSAPPLAPRQGTPPALKATSPVLQGRPATPAALVLAPTQAVETLTDAAGTFTFALRPATLPARVLVEVSVHPALLPEVRTAKWGTAESARLDMGLIMIPQPQEAEMPMANGAGQSRDGSIDVAGMPAEVHRVFARAYDPDDDPEAFPGGFAAMGAMPLHPTVFWWIEALDASGTPMTNLSHAVTIQARVLRPQWSALIDRIPGTDRIDIPIYLYNENSNRWEQVGMGWLQDDLGTLLPEAAQAALLNGTFRGEVLATFVTTHLSWYLAGAPGGPCDPLSPPGMQGCATGQKCTWMRIQETPDAVGQLGCVPAGPVALGGTCTQGAAGATTGYDNCQAGLICIASVCKDICGFDGSANTACASGEACTRYANLFANGDDAPVAGACNPTCDPLTQTRVVNGQRTTCGQGQGCYLLASDVDTLAVCAGAGSPTHNQPIIGPVFANSCAPGHMPRTAVQDQPGAECGALCKPADVYNGLNDGRNGRPNYEGGNSSVFNWMTPAKPATCESAGGPTVRPEVPGTGESCQFYWTREPSVNLTAFSNTLGWCFNFASWRYDPDGMEPINNTDAYPRCINVTTGDVLPPLDPTQPQNDALYFGCVQLPALDGALAPSSSLQRPALDGAPEPSAGHPVTRAPARQPKLDRLGPYTR